MDWQLRTPDKKHAKRLLLAAMVVATVSGCASGRGVSLTKTSPAMPNASAVAAQPTQDSSPEPNPMSDVDWSQVIAQPSSTPVQAVGYNDGVFVASPAVFAQPPKEQSDRSFGDFLQLDPPRDDDKDAMPPEVEADELDVDEKDADDDAKDGKDDADDTSDDDSAATGESDEEGQAETIATPLSTGQPVEYFVGTALARHPKILAARQRVSAATNVIPQAKALPDPTFNNTFWPLHGNALQTAGGRVGNQMSVNQMVPFPDKLKTKAVIASREVQMAQTEVDAIAREITESVRLAYYEVWFATRAISIIEETKELVADLTDVAEARYRSGGSQQDVLRAQLETDRLDEKLIGLRKQKQVAQADLATLLQQPVGLLPEASNELGVTDTPQQIESLIAQAEQCNPKLRGLAWEIQRDRDKERLACLQQYPDFSVGLNWGIISDGHDVLSPVADGQRQPEH